MKRLSENSLEYSPNHNFRPSFWRRIPGSDNRLDLRFSEAFHFGVQGIGTRNEKDYTFFSPVSQESETIPAGSIQSVDWSKDGGDTRIIIEGKTNNIKLFTEACLDLNYKEGK